MFTTVLGWLDETAAKYPDKKAYFTDEASVTFSQIQSLTRSVGSFIADNIPFGNPVLCMSGRHPLTPVLFLSVVRGGSFYAPMDSGMPVARLNQIIKTVNGGYMIVDRENLEKAKELDFDGKIFVFEDLTDTPVNESALKQAEKSLTPFSPLYCIFTSGSTGAPKGVVTSHHSLMCYIDAFSEMFGADENDVFGSQAPLDYIAAIRDIYLPLKNGSSTVIIPKNEFSMPIELFSTLNRHGVTALCWSVAGVELPAKLNAFSQIKPLYLKKVCFSGSVMPGKYLKIWQEALPDVMYVNQYGPTEATASCTFYIVSEKADEKTVLPIGEPYRNYKVFLLSPDNKAVPDGKEGEICVSGPCVTLGYLNNPEKTKQSFIQNPLNPYYREIIYKTGDIGKKENGLLYFLGRTDRQIKHMGHRIELEEIEGTAKQIDGVESCCALYFKEKELLHLFYTGNASPKEITLYFRANMPAFSVPRRIIQLQTLPLLPNGKTDMNELKKYFKQ